MNLFISNLSPETSEITLRDIFSEFGDVVSVKIPIDSATGMPRGFGFVEMGDKNSGFDAIDNIDQTFLDGNIIAVKESKPKTQGGGNSGGGFNKRPGGFNRNGGGGFNSNRGGGGNYNRDSGSSYNRDNNNRPERRNNNNDNFNNNRY
jgi:RNA recognition motif-containing protein